MKERSTLCVGTVEESTDVTMVAYGTAGEACPGRLTSRMTRTGYLGTALDGGLQATYQRPFVEGLAQKANGSGALRAKSKPLFGESGDEND